MIILILIGVIYKMATINNDKSYPDLNICECKNHEVLNFNNMEQFPDSPVISLEDRNKYISYVSGRRQGINMTDQMGVFTLQIDSNQGNFSSPTNIVQNALLLDENGRPIKVLEPSSSIQNNVFDYLISITSTNKINVFGQEYINGFFQAEDRYENNENKYSIMYQNGDAYGRIGHSISNDGMYFQKLFYNKVDSTGEEELNVISPNTFSPIIEHWQSEEVCYREGLHHHPITGQSITKQDPAGVKGTGPSSVVEVDGYYYLFYSRFIDSRQQNYDPQYNNYPGYGYPPFLSQTILPEDVSFLNSDTTLTNAFRKSMVSYMGGNVCVARASKPNIEKVIRYNLGEIDHMPSDVWQKYRKIRKLDNNGIWSGRCDFDCNKEQWVWGEEPQWSEVWCNSGNGGLDSSIMPPMHNVVYAQVSWNLDLNRFIMVGINSNYEIELFCSHIGKCQSSLLKWYHIGTISDIHSGARLMYPSLIGVNSKTSSITGYENMLYYGFYYPSTTGGINAYMGRSYIMFDEV